MSAYVDCECGMAKIPPNVKQCSTCEIADRYAAQVAKLERKLAAMTAERDALKAELATLKQEHGPFVERGVYLSLKSNHRAAVAGAVSAKAQVEALKAGCERKDEALRRVRSVVAGYQRPSETHVAVIDAALSPAQTKP